MSINNRIILFDNDVFLFEDLKALDKKVLRHPLVVISKQPDLLKALNNKLEPIDLLIIKDGLPGVTTPALIEEIKKTHPEIPIAITSSKEITDEEAQVYKSLGVVETLPRPKNLEVYLQLSKKIHKDRSDFSGVEASSHALDEELELEEIFIPTPVNGILLTPKSFFNLYLKLSEKKYVKVLNAGDAITTEFLEKYLNKNVINLFIEQNEHLKYIKLSNAYAASVVAKNPELDLSKHSNVLLHGADNLTNNLSRVGINPENIQIAWNFLQSTYEFIQRANVPDQKFAQFLKLMSEHAHSSSVILLSTLLSKELGFESTKTVKIVGTAAMLHDIHLVKNLPELTEVQIASGQDPQYVEIYANHAKEGATYLRGLNLFDEIVCQAVEQHHLRKGAKESSSKINLVSEIIGICDEFANFVLSSPTPEARMEYFFMDPATQFSSNVQKSFEDMLKKNDKKAS